MTTMAFIRTLATLFFLVLTVQPSQTRFQKPEESSVTISTRDKYSRKEMHIAIPDGDKYSRKEMRIHIEVAEPRKCEAEAKGKN